MTASIHVRQLTKRYGQVEAVDSLSLTVQPGEIYGFLGLNGSGKTTTIRALLGMVTPTAGTVEMLGLPVYSGARDIWANVGYMVETTRSYADLTVTENLQIARRLHQVRERQAVTRIIARLGLTPYANRKAGKLSLGNKQRLGLAKALIHDPQLLILDEPANGLDPAGVVEVREILRDHANEHGGTVFMSSHVLGEVARLATRIGIIHNGRLVEEFSAGDLERRCRRWLVIDARDRSAARETLTTAGFVPINGDGPLMLDGDAAVDHPDDIARLLVGNGVAPTRLSVEQEDLETHFMRVIGQKHGELQCTA
jgi:ABC-2 type transport system ATP-binding protein